MNAKHAGLMVIALALGVYGCSTSRHGGSDEVEAGETKVRLEQTPPAVRKTIEGELNGGQLEDIALKKKKGQVIYETDIIRDGRKWEVNVAEDGSIVSKSKEGRADEAKGEKAGDSKGAGADPFRKSFDVDKAMLESSGNSRYLPIQPGKILRLAHGNEKLTITILPETKTIDGVKVGILEEREEKDGQLIEVSHNFFATDKNTGDVYYFGEDVDNYKDGKIINHDSAWRAGVKGAQFGLMLPGTPKKGAKFYQEIAPGVALDRVEVVSTDATVKTPAGTFKNCVHLRETTPLESDVSHKYYAPGIGMIKDDEFELVEKP